MQEPTFFLDENISWRVAKALHALEHSVIHLLDELPQGTADTTYFPYIAARGWFLITQDKKIRKKPHERRAMVDAGVGAFVLTGQANKTTDELAVHLLNRWTEIVEIARRTPRPFVFGIPDRGRAEPLDR